MIRKLPKLLWYTSARGHGIHFAICPPRFCHCRGIHLVVLHVVVVHWFVIIVHIHVHLIRRLHGPHLGFHVEHAPLWLHMIHPWLLFPHVVGVLHHLLVLPFLRCNALLPHRGQTTSNENEELHGSKSLFPRLNMKAREH